MGPITFRAWSRKRSKLHALRRMHPAWNIHLSDSGVYWASPVGASGISLRGTTPVLLTQAISFYIDPPLAVAA